MSQHVMLEGPAGRIEAEYDEGGSTTAVLCHPHPLYGGSLSDAVLAELCGAFHALGAGTLRFNFRGVGASEGEHDKGVGEVDDVLAACRWAQGQHAAGHLILGGYSFGAAAAIKAAPEASASGLILIAPPPALIGDAPRPDRPTVIIVGDGDTFVDIDELRRWIGDAPVELIVVEGADHFFMGHASALREAVSLTMAKLPG